MENPWCHENPCSRFARPLPLPRARFRWPLCRAASVPARWPTSRRAPRTRISRWRSSVRDDPLVFHSRARFAGGASGEPAVKESAQARSCECHVLTLAGMGGVKPTGTEPFLPRVRDEIINYIREQKTRSSVDRRAQPGRGDGALDRRDRAGICRAGWWSWTRCRSMAAIIDPDGHGGKRPRAVRADGWRFTPGRIRRRWNSPTYQQKMMPQWVSVRPIRRGSPRGAQPV